MRRISQKVYTRHFYFQVLPFATLAVESMNSAKILYQELGFRYHRSITIFNEEYHLYVADAYEK